ncbi:hypothetical protein [Halostella litorea]|uniref:hypothetical protein n=1 Tax=Halostella litorea TaxID=2528831 RepID=UPI0010920351|nr:hypothetical protein [Halostella litorea]
MSRVRTATGRVADYVHASVPRRATLALGVSLTFLLCVELAAGDHLGLLPIPLAVGLAAYLYTRRSGQEALAASAYGTGLLAVGLFVLQVYQVVATASTESPAAAAARSGWWLVVGALLTAAGVGIRRLDL